MRAVANIYSGGQVPTIILCAVLLIITLVAVYRVESHARRRRRHSWDYMPYEPEDYPMPSWRIVDPPPPPLPPFDIEDPKTWPEAYHQEWR